MKIILDGRYICEIIDCLKYNSKSSKTFKLFEVFLNDNFINALK